MLSLSLSSCSVFGGNDTSAKISAALKTALKQTTEQVDKSKKELSNIQGDVLMIEQRITQIQTEITTINQQITTMETTNNNTPFWEIALPLIGMYAIWEIIKLLKALVIARVNAGSTIKNLLGLKGSNNG